MDPTLGTVEALSSEARIAPGVGEDDDECDWSADDSDVEVVIATSAATADAEMQDVKEEALVKDEDVKMGEDPSTLTSGSGSVTPTGSKGIEKLEPKTEEIIEEEAAPPRRRRIKFGSAHLHLLKAVADADTANWQSLQTAIGAAPAGAKVKSELVDRLSQLAELRVESLAGAEKKAREHADRAKFYSEAETEFRKGLNEEMLRLEKLNPVGPRAAVPLVSDARLKRDIEAGKPIWQARRDHRARERAARKRQADAQGRPGNPESSLIDLPPEEGAKALDDAFAASAKANLDEFRKVLKEEAAQGQATKKRKPDSAQRKKIKKQRKRERGNTKDDAERDRNHSVAHRPKVSGHTKDDAERDRNHAVAHSYKGPVASISPGVLLMMVCQACLVRAHPMVGESDLLSGDDLRNPPSEGWEFWLASLWMAVFFLGTSSFG